MVIAALFTRAKARYQSKCLSTNEWKKEDVRYSYRYVDIGTERDKVNSYIGTQKGGHLSGPAHIANLNLS